MSRKTTKKPKYCVIYARVSESRTSKESQSCQAQEEICRHYAFKKWEVLKVCTDHSKSGKALDNRPGLQKAIDLACKKKAVLLCYSLSRVARNIRHLLSISDTLSKAGADFACVKESFDTTTMGGRFIFHIFAALEEFQREQIAERTSDAMHQYIASGRKMMSNAVYGYRFEGDKMVEDEYEQAVIRRVRELRDMGLSYNRIIEQLNIEGYKPRKKKFHYPLIWSIVNQANPESQEAPQA